MNNIYLVTYRDSNGLVFEPKLARAREIFEVMDMADCHDCSIHSLYCVNDGEPVACIFYGPWHDFATPLKMIIERKDNGEILDTGIGTDH